MKRSFIKSMLLASMLPFKNRVLDSCTSESSVFSALYSIVASNRTAFSASRNFGMAVCCTGDSRSINAPGT